MKNNNGINIFGYSYDNKQNKYVVNANQAKVVKTIYELYNKYYLNLDEIEELIKGNIDIDYIIASRIERIYIELNEQQLESKNPFDKLNIANLLKCAYGLREHLINHFTELNKINQAETSIDNTNDKISKVQEYNDKFNSLISKYEGLIKNIEDSNDANSENKRFRNAIPNLLNNIMVVIPKEVQLTSIENTSDTHIVIKAKSARYEQIAYFKTKLKTEGILKNVVSDTGTAQGGYLSVTIEGELP